METIEDNVAKLQKMRDYIEKCKSELSTVEDAEFAKRMRQFWSAKEKRKKYLDKLTELEEEHQKSIKVTAKNNNLIFISALLVGIAIHYLDLIDKSSQTILGIGFFAVIVIREIASELNSTNYKSYKERWNEQVDFYNHEIDCSGGGLAIFVNVDFNEKNADDSESKKVIRTINSASEEIAVLHGLKSEIKFTDF
jgi:hypothetical protein